MPLLQLALAVVTVAAAAWGSLPPPAGPAYSLVGTVAADEAIERANSLLEPVVTTVGECGRLCSQQEGQCVGFTWAPRDNDSEVSLAGDGLGRCEPIKCVPDYPTAPGTARLYLTLAGGLAPRYGVLEEVPSGYTSRCTYAYRVYKSKANFSEARAICERDRARLFFIRNQAQHDAINGALIRSTPHWIGLADLDGSRIFLWLDGTPVEGISEWGQNQPNNFKGAGEAEPQSCVTVHNGVWNDQQCSQHHAFACQVPFVDV